MSIEGSLLEKACQGVSSLHLPACVKNSELRYICVNQAYARFAGKNPQDFAGQTSRTIFSTADDVEREDKERRCLVFATDEVATCRGILPEAQTLRCERFIDETGQIFLYEVFEKMPDFDSAPRRNPVSVMEGDGQGAEENGGHRSNAARWFSEIKTPLTGILRMADALARTDLDTRQRIYADTILQSGNALLRSLDAVLSASATDTSESLQTSLFDPADLVEEIASLLAFHADEKALTLFTDIDSSAEITIEADAARLRKIVTHLVSNAIRFTQSGHVLVRLKAENFADSASLRLTIEDSGIGMSQEQLASILGQKSRSAPAAAGLAETLRIVSLFDGRIEAKSEENSGSVFTVTLPVSVISAQPITPLWPAHASILVIDGNPMSRDILTRHLSDWKLDAYAAEDGTTGLAVLEEAVALGLRPAALLVDEAMPDMRANDVVSYLRRHPGMQDIPVILLTTLGERDACENAQAYLTKPVRRQKLRETLEALIPAPALTDIPSPSVTAPVEDDQPCHLPPPPRKNGSGIDVLVAEDNDVNQIVFSQILQQTGLSFRIVANGKKAVEAWRNESPALILMDVSMPVMSGYHATQSIRQMEDDEDGRLGRVPIIGVTAHALDLDSELCLASGMDDFVSKPISPELLRAKISQWLPKGALEAF